VAGRAGGEGCPRERRCLSLLDEATSCLASNQPFRQGAENALRVCSCEEQQDNIGQENYYDIFFHEGCGTLELDLKHRIMFTSC